MVIRVYQGFDYSRDGETNRDRCHHRGYVERGCGYSSQAKPELSFVPLDKPNGILQVSIGRISFMCSGVV